MRIALLYLCSAGALLAFVGASSKVSKFEITVDNVNFAVFDRELNEPPNGYQQVKFGEKISKQFQVDSHQKVHLKFVVKDKQKNAPVLVHQAFVTFVHAESQREVIYVAEPEKQDAKAYAFDLNMKSHFKEFSGVSGKYAVSLILGDASVTNPVHWALADVIVDVPAVEPTSVPKSKHINYAKMPEIVHTFAQPEPRPPQTVSDFFALLCALPMLALFVFWIRIGVNFKNVVISIWALGFHVGLAGIFVLYFFYWTQLNMFQTLQYLCWIGLFTFVCGNRFLHNFHKAKKQKSE